MAVITRTFEVNVPATWDTTKNKVGDKEKQEVTAKQAQEFTDILEIYENDEAKAVEAVNNTLANQAKSRAYQNAMARVRPPDDPVAARQRAITSLIRVGMTEERAREIVEGNAQV